MGGATMTSGGASALSTVRERRGYTHHERQRKRVNLAMDDHSRRSTWLFIGQTITWLPTREG